MSQDTCQYLDALIEGLRLEKFLLNGMSPTDEEWLLLIYIKNNSPDEGIVIEDKTNPEKNISHEFKNNEIFKASDTMVDSLTQLIARKRAKNNN